MLFTQARFLAFFLVVFLVHWSLSGARARKLWLLAASYVFYAAWDWRFLALLWFSTAVDFFCALAMDGRERPRRRPWLALSVAVNLGLLALFKYFDFFIDSALALLQLLGLEPHRTTLAFALPIGISFYTFQSLSYTIDVFRGRLRATRKPLEFALFVSFFPQLGAGPIARATTVLPQLDEPRRFAEHVDIRAALLLFLGGFLKKACIADSISAVVDPVFAEPGLVDSGSAWTALLLYHVQIYCDFSGYTDMAIAIAGLLGYRLPENFDFPYFSRGIGEFWRRWHISLSTWLRDYLYLPLVGKRPSPVRRWSAVLATMSLCGLWHGAGWQFVGFGFLHGLYVVIEDLWTRAGAVRERFAWLTGPIAVPAVNLLVLLTWPVFRMRSLEQAHALYSRLFSFEASGASVLGARALLFVVGCALVHWLARNYLPLRIAARWPSWAFALSYGLAWSLVLPWVAVELAPFIYFQF